jgi:hypothetical protein
VIETVLRQVAGPNLLKTVTHLSSYHTRLSTAPGTTEAEVWISSEMIRYGFQVSSLWGLSTFAAFDLSKARVAALWSI